MQTTRIENLESKYFEDQSNKETQPINPCKQTSRQDNKIQILQSLQFQTNKKRKDTQRRHLYIQKFLNNIQVEKKQYKKLNEFHLDIINDKGSSQLEREEVQVNSNNNRWFKNVQESINKILNRIPLIYPQTKYKTLLNIIAVITRLYFAFVIPLDLGWQDKSFIFYDFKVISTIALLIIILDLIISLNTAYYKDGQLVTNRSEILKHSLFNSFGMQWFSVLLLIIFLFLSFSGKADTGAKDTISNLLLVLFLVHFKPIITIVNYYEENFNFNKQIQSCLELVKLLFVLFYSIHFFSCIWILVGSYGVVNYEKSWLLQVGISEQEWQIQYLYAFYYSAVTIFTIGYGDITPQSSAEKVLAITYIIVASIQLPYSVSTVGTIIQQITGYKEEKKRKLRIINSYLNQQQISKDLQIQVREYLTYRWDNEQLNKESEVDEIINQLSQDLHDSLITESCSQLLKKCKLFKLGFSLNFKTNLVKHAKQIQLQPEQELIINNSSDINFYYITQGQLQFLLSNGQKLGVINQGNSIGLHNFINPNLSEEKYSSIGFSKLIVIGQKQFLKLLQEYPQDYEIYCKIKEDLVFSSQKDSLLPFKCFSCLKYNHFIQQCPLLHYIPEKEKIIKRIVFPTQQNRQTVKRRVKLVNFSSKSQILKELQNASEQIVNDNPEILQLYDVEDNIQQLIQQDINLQQKVDQKQNKFQAILKQHQILVNNQKNKLKSAVEKIKQNNSEVFQNLHINLNCYQMKKELINKILELRFNCIKNLNSFIFQKEISLIQQLMYQQTFDKSYEISIFETPANFKYYNPDWNFDNTCKFKQKRNQKLIKQLLFYFLYPCKIIDQFKIQQLNCYSIKEQGQ